jgi:hypothetical protein
MTLPDDLFDYFKTLILPPDLRLLYVSDDRTTWEEVGKAPDASFEAAIVLGTPTPEQARELLRVLLPGAHAILVAPDEEPTGHTGACRVEDAGFEVRDAILLADQATGLHYVPKPNRTERDAGCAHLEGKSGVESADKIKNSHPTIKPIELMEKLMWDVPKSGGAVLDPFVGSGTTAIAAVRTGRSVIGIEREREYLEIADARVRHWIRETPEIRYREVQVVSDIEPKALVAKKVSFEDAFGFGEDD